MDKQKQKLIETPAVQGKISLWSRIIIESCPYCGESHYHDDEPEPGDFRQAPCGHGVYQILSKINQERVAAGGIMERDIEELSQLSGRDLDIAVAEALGYRYMQHNTTDDYNLTALLPPAKTEVVRNGKPIWIPSTPEAERFHDWDSAVPYYSAYLSSAWELVEYLRNIEPHGYWCRVQNSFSPEDSRWWAGFTPHLTSGWNGVPDNWTSGSTVCEAICRAFLVTMHWHNQEA